MEGSAILQMNVSFGAPTHDLGTGYSSLRLTLSRGFGGAGSIVRNTRFEPMKLPLLTLRDLPLGDMPIPWVQGTIVMTATVGGCALGSYLGWQLVANGWNQAIAGLIGITIAVALSASGFLAIAVLGIRG